MDVQPTRAAPSRSSWAKIVRGAIICLMLGGALLLLAFGPRPSLTLPPDRRDDVVVTYWEKWTGDEGDQMKKIVEEFNATVGREKHIYVQYVSMSSINQKTLVSTAAGAPPDVAGVWQANVVQYAAQDALEPLEDLAKAHGITAQTYKPIYWRGCNWQGHLWCLISTPSTVALHYNRQMFIDNADKLRAGGCDPDRPPRTIEELDRYAAALDTFTGTGGDRRLDRAGYLPMEPGWFINWTCYWFGGEIFNEKTGKFTLDDPNTLRAYQWIQGYSKRLGFTAVNAFQSAAGNFDSPQNPFLARKVAMEQQGPWMANYIEHLNPSMSMNRKEAVKLPLDERRKHYEWAAAPFPSAVPGMEDVSFADFDALVIPRGAAHKNEAFEFMAYVNRQPVMEELCSMHCKNSPLANVSSEFIKNHPNPYIDVFEKLARSPNCHISPQIPILPEVSEELSNMTQLVYQLKDTPEHALAHSQEVLQQKYDDFLKKQAARRAAAPVQ